MIKMVKNILYCEDDRLVRDSVIGLLKIIFLDTHFITSSDIESTFNRLSKIDHLDIAMIDGVLGYPDYGWNLAKKLRESVGSSMAIASRCGTSGESEMVSPIYASGSPAMMAISPFLSPGATSSVPPASDKPSRLARAVTAAMKSLRACGA